MSTPLNNPSKEATPTHTFDPDSSAKEKVETVLKESGFDVASSISGNAREILVTGLVADKKRAEEIAEMKKAHGVTVVTSKDTSKENQVKEEVNTVQEDSTSSPTQVTVKPPLPSAYPITIPRDEVGNPILPPFLSTLLEKFPVLEPYLSLVEGFVYIQTLGLYAIIVGAIFATWFVTKMGLGLGWVIVILLIVDNAYRRGHRTLTNRIHNEMKILSSLKKVF